jgi:hypothetical protein
MPSLRNLVFAPGFRQAHGQLPWLIKPSATAGFRGLDNPFTAKPAGQFGGSLFSLELSEGLPFPSQ